MNYIVLVIAIVAIILVFLARFLGLSIIYPTLVIVLAILLDIVTNKIKSRKEKKERNNIKDIINKM